MRAGPLVALLALALLSTCGASHRASSRLAGLRSSSAHELADHLLHSRKILLLGEVIDTEAAPDARDLRGTGRYALADADDAQHHIYFVQLEAPVTAAAQRAVEAAGGVRLGPYIPHNAYLVSATVEQLARIRAVPHVVWAGRLKREHKAHPMLAGPAARAYSTWTAHVAAEWAAGQGVPTAHRLAGVWRRQLSASLRGNFSIEALDEGRVRVTLRNPHDGPLALEFLTSKPSVHWVEPRRPLAFKNVFASRLFQGDFASSAAEMADPVARPDALPTPVYDKGITGSGEIIGLIDDGIDFDHCYFAESKGVTAVAAPAVSSVAADLTKRKVVAARYDPVWGDPTASTAHGSHTAGTLVGRPCEGCVPEDPGAPTTAAGAAAHRGIAYDAKVTLYNVVNKSSSALLSADWYSVFALHYADGARIHSNSWGCAPLLTDVSSCNLYDADSVMADRYMWNHTDALLVWAAGNDGIDQVTRESGDVVGAVSAPSTHKNGLAVGASFSSTAGFLWVTQPVAGGPSLAAANGKCASGGEVSGAEEWCDRSQMSAGSGAFNSRNLASFSSSGPAWDGRVKPELVAPGFLTISAAADSKPASFNCGLRTEEGTSMSTPAAAGAAALVRQYFREGWWPSGARSGADAIPRPLASLVKAALVNGARPLTGTVTTVKAYPGAACTSDKSCRRLAVGPPSAPVPNKFQGYGLVRLDTVLYFQNSPFKMGFCDGAFGPSGAVAAPAVSFSLSVVGTLRATLAWTDPPNDPRAGKALVNDLDLALVVPGGTVYPNALTGPDRINNLEHVEWTTPSNTTNVTVIIRVSPYSVLPKWGAQQWSLVLHGNWQGPAALSCPRSLSVPASARAAGPSNPYGSEEVPVPQAGGPALLADVTLDLEYEAWLANGAHREQFARGLAAQLGVGLARVVVHGAARGSTVVTVSIAEAAASGAQEASLAEAYRTLARLNTNLDLGPGLVVLALSRFRPAGTAAPTPTPGGTTTTGGGGGGGSNTGAIIGGVVGAVLGVALLAAVVFIALRLTKRKPKAPKAPPGARPGESPPASGRSYALPHAQTHRPEHPDAPYVQKDDWDLPHASSGHSSLPYAGSGPGALPLSSASSAVHVALSGDPYASPAPSAGSGHLRVPGAPLSPAPSGGGLARAASGLARSGSGILYPQRPQPAPGRSRDFLDWSLGHGEGAEEPRLAAAPSAKHRLDALFGAGGPAPPSLSPGPTPAAPTPRTLPRPRRPSPPPSPPPAGEVGRRGTLAAAPSGPGGARRPTLAPALSAGPAFAAGSGDEYSGGDGDGYGDLQRAASANVRPPGPGRRGTPFPR
eukprot:tig00021612_g22869.t1